MSILQSTFDKHRKLMLESIVQDRLRNEAAFKQKKQQLLASGLRVVPMQGGEDKKYFAYTSGRYIVLIDMGNIKLPFYCSSGEGGKANVPAGKWYPILGISKSGWFNKGTEEQINNYYGSSAAKSVAKKLDEVLGDVRDMVFLMEHMVFVDKVLPIINQDLNPPDQRPTQERSKEYKEIYTANVTNVLQKIGGNVGPVPIKGKLTLTHGGKNVVEANISANIGRSIIQKHGDDAKYFSSEQFQLQKQKDDTWKLIRNKDATNITTIDGKEVTEPTTLAKGMKIAIGKTGKFPMEVV